MLNQETKKRLLKFIVPHMRTAIDSGMTETGLDRVVASEACAEVVMKYMGEFFEMHIDCKSQTVVPVKEEGVKASKKSNIARSQKK